MDSGFSIKAEERQAVDKWVAELGVTDKASIGIVSWKQGWGKLNFGRSFINEPICLADKEYGWGLGTHADSEIILRCSKPIKTFRAWTGVDCNRGSAKGTAEMIFVVQTNDNVLAESCSLNVKSQPEWMDVSLGGATEFTLKVKSVNTNHLAHADWADAEVVTVDGEILKIGMPEMGVFLAKTLPISFEYNGMDSEAWFTKWGIRHTTSKQQEITTHQFICADDDTGLECTLELQEYKKLPVCLWNVYFRNTGNADTPILKQVKTLDLNWAAPDEKELFRGRGSFNYENAAITGEAFRDNFMLVRNNLIRDPEITMGAIGGRPSVDWMPYFNFAGKGEGLMFGIGWTGQWQAQINAKSDHVNFQVGMEHIHTLLKPGESIRQPAILMIYWKGEDPIRGHNLLRRFIQENLLPTDGMGKTLQAPACNLTWGGMIAGSHLERIKNLDKEKIPVDYYWIDAGWYGQAGPSADEFDPAGWSTQGGDWRINREVFPKGFRPLSDVLHASGRKFLLWVEPEDALCGAPITQEHSDWFFGSQKNKGNLLLNLGHPDAWKWCTKLIADMIAEQGIDCYRQDFNTSPLPYWQANNTPDRVGMTEIRYIEGLYAFLDELRRRFPNLLIDNCASGGRRLDFEMMRRSLPLWASDMQCFPDYITERNQQQVHSLSYWLPQFSFGTQDHAGDTYHFRSTMASGINIHLFSYERCSIRSDYPYQWLQDRLDEYHRAKVYFNGDFYPLLPQSDLFHDWSAYQFHRPDLGGGILEVFRKKDSPIEKICFEFRGLDPATSYKIEDVDSKKIAMMSGRELMEKGWPVEIARKRDSRLFFYQVSDTKKY